VNVSDVTSKVQDLAGEVADSRKLQTNLQQELNAANKNVVASKLALSDKEQIVQSAKKAVKTRKVES